MKKISCLIILLLQFSFSFSRKAIYNEGYIVKGKDTVSCKILFQPDEDLAISVSVLFNDNTQVKYKPLSDEVIAFGFTNDGIENNYTLLPLKIPKETRRTTLYLFARKLISGPITICKATYKLTKFTSNKTTGENKKYDAEIFTDYLIQKKTDSLLLTVPQELTSFKKKDLIIYFNDHQELSNKISKKSSLKELLDLAKEYNTWFTEKRKI